MSPPRTALSRRAALQGLVGAAGLACGAGPPPAGLQPLLAALSRLRGRFDAPPDEA